MAYIVKWQCQNSGKTGQGNPTSDRKVAESWADEMNKEYPWIDHWVEKEITPKLGEYQDGNHKFIRKWFD